uniref:ComEC/Rec2 family competence protein n=1 Tax=Paenibacillus dakarensis TaxID=1527293 RepID=UPI0012E0E53E
FLVTAGLMIFVPKLMPFLSSMPRWLAGTVGVTLAAQLVSFPLTIYYFNQFSLLSIFANLLLVPLISLIVLPMGMIAVIASTVWLTGGKWIAVPIEWLNSFTFSIVEWMNNWASSLTIWPSPKLWWITAYFILLFMLLDRGSKRRQAMLGTRKNPDDTVPLSGNDVYRKPEDREYIASPELSFSERLRSLGLYRLADLWERFGDRMAATTLAGLFLLLLFAGYHGPAKQGNGWVQFLDVGQGDSILVSTPEGKHILIDAGGTTSFRKEKDAWKERSQPFEVGEKVVVPLLKKRGVHSLDMVVITHNHQDHSGGLQAVLEQIPVKSILFNGTWTESKAFEQLMKTAVVQDIPIYQAYSGTVYHPDPFTELRFLNTGLKAEEQTVLPVVENQNHESLVFELRMNEARFLFTGDADEKAEQRILTEQARGITKNHDDDDEEIRPLDVLKAGHHGSKTSTSEEWLKAWKPGAAVISAGVNNMYRHPHPDVVNRLQRYGTLVYRTDLRGEIQMKVSRKGKIEVRTKLRTDDGIR